MATSVAIGAPSADAAAKGPRCARVAGATVGQSDTWRLVRTSYRQGKDRLRRVVACRLADRPPIKVRVLGAPSTENGTDFSASLSGGLVSVYKGMSSSHGAYGSTQLIELATGRTRALGQRAGGESNSPGQTLRSALSPTGAVATATWASQSDLPGGPLVVAGQGGLTSGELVSRLVPSLGTGPSDAGFYFSRPDGSAGRVIAGGPLPRALTTASKALRWRKLPLRTSGPRARSITRAVPGPTGGTAAWVVTDRRGGVRHDTLVVGNPAPGANGIRTPLAPGSGAEVAVLVQGGSDTLAAARFADRPTERRIRTVGAYDTTDPQRPQIDLAANAALESPGHLAITNCGWIAAADGDRLQLWDPAPHELTVPGVHDLVPGALPSREPGPCDGLFATDGAGAARAVPLTPSF